MPIEFVLALPWVVGIGGLLLLAAGAAALLRVDERFFSRDNYCCRCQNEWHGIEKLCNKCGALGQGYRSPEHKLPTHDWQGYLDTGPVPIVNERLFDPERLAAVPITPREDLSPLAPENWSE